MKEEKTVKSVDLTLHAALHVAQPSTNHNMWEKSCSSPGVVQIAAAETFFSEQVACNAIKYQILFQIVPFRDFPSKKSTFLFPDFSGLKSVLSQLFHACKSNS